MVMKKRPLGKPPRAGELDDDDDRPTQQSTSRINWKAVMFLLLVVTPGVIGAILGLALAPHPHTLITSPNWVSH